MGGLDLRPSLVWFLFVLNNSVFSSVHVSLRIPVKHVRILSRVSMHAPVQVVRPCMKCMPHGMVWHETS